MKILAKETRQIIKLNGKNVLLFELFYRIITLPAYLRLLDRGLKSALRMAGYSYLTAGNIGSFLIRPWTVLVILAVGAVGTALLVLEVAGLITAFEGSAYGRRLTPLHIFRGALQKVADEVRRKNILLCFVVLADYFLVNLFLIGRLLTHVKPMNFVIREIAGRPPARLAVIVFLAVCALFAVRTMFVCFCCMVEQKAFPDSVAKSRRLLRGHAVQSVALLAGAAAAVVLLVTALYLLSVFAAAVFVVLFTDKSLAMAVLLSVSDKLELVILFLGSILLTVVDFGALSVLYYRYGSVRSAEPRWDFGGPEKEKRSRRQIGAAVCIIVAVSLFYIFDLVHNGFSLSDEILVETGITAHRGSSRKAPENTMAAMAAAVEELADYAELDVQMTLDGVVVLGHDASLKRVAGVNRAIGSLTFAQLEQLDVGSWFSADYAGERIPTLDEVMEFCKGKINLNIEIKNVGKTSVLPESVVGLIADHEMQEQCVVTSTSVDYLKRVKALAPELRTGYIISAAYGNFYSGEAVDFISIRSSFVSERLVEDVHAQGKTIHAWTVNTKSEMERLRLLGVDNLITDYPVLAREIVYREEATETLMEYLRLVFR